MSASTAVIGHVFTVVPHPITSNNEPKTYHRDAECPSIKGNRWIGEDYLPDLKAQHPDIRACKRCCK